MKPAHVAITRSPHRMVGMVCCPWLQEEPIHHESLTERWFIILALLLPGIKRIQHQPFRVALPDGCGKDGTSDGTYTPDFLLQFDCGGQIVIEVKPEVFVAAHRRKLKYAAQQLRQRRLSLYVITDECMSKLASAREAMLLRRRAMQHHDINDVERVLSLVQNLEGGVHAAVLCEQAVVGFELIVWLVVRGEVHADNPFRLSVTSLIYSISATEVDHANVYVERWFGTAAW